METGHPEFISVGETLQGNDDFETTFFRLLLRKYCLDHNTHTYLQKWFYSISTVVEYLMSKPVYTYILDM